MNTMIRQFGWSAAVALVLACNGGNDDSSTSGPSAGSSSTTSVSTTTTATTTTGVDPTTGGSTSSGNPTTGGETSSTTGSTTTTGESSSSSGEASSTGVMSTGVAPFCGDEVVDPGEECDLGAMNSDTGTCTSGCKNAVCGDALVGPGEACDDGNADDADACTNMCALAGCGDGILQGNEVCDDGNADNTDACLDTCVAASCGDGFAHVGDEACDDGNADNKDACTTLCKAPACDDGILSGTESDVDCGGGCTPCGVDAACVAGSDCGSGFCNAGQCKIAAKCADIKVANPAAASGIYTIDPDGDAGEPPFAARCEMTTDGGGWTLVLNLDTSDGHVMWWANAAWTDGSSFGTAPTALTADHISVGWKNYSDAKDVLLVVHTEGTTVGWKSFTKTVPGAMRSHVMAGDNVQFGAEKNADIAAIWAGERLVRLSTKLYANRCVQTGGQCTSGAAGSPDGDRIGSVEATPADNVGGGLGNWHDMNYCCNANYGSGKTCNGQAIRTASEAQAGWAPCYNGGNGHFGSDTFAPASGTCSNAVCGQANWSALNGLAYDYSLYLR